MTFMKRILFSLFLLFSLATNASASVSEKIQLEFAKGDGVLTEGIVAVFNEKNILVDAKKCSIDIKNNICTTEFLTECKDEIKEIRIYFPESGIIIKNAKEPQAINKYPTKLDAETAFMMVKDVTSEVVGEEVKTRLDVFFRGGEQTLYFDEDKTLLASPSTNTELIGAPLTSLKAGDIIYCSTTIITGKILTVELIYRPCNDDIITDTENFGTNFENLFTYNGYVTSVRPTPVAMYGVDNYLQYQYAFGLIKDKKKNYIELCNKNGVAGEDMIVPISNSTIVYVYDKAQRNKVYIGTVADIQKSEIYSFDLDSDENVISWSEDAAHNYALVRMAEGSALEMAIYLNY